MTTINSVNNNDNQYFPLKNAMITTAGVAVGWESQTLIGKYSKYPLRRYINSNIKEAQGDGFLVYVNKAIEQNNLKNDLKVIDLNKGNAEQVKQKLKVKFDKKIGKVEKVILHILRFPNNKNSFNATVNGKNAFSSPLDNAVVCNFKKFGAPIFHEIQHKLNSK